MRENVMRIKFAETMTTNILSLFGNNYEIMFDDHSDEVC